MIKAGLFRSFKNRSAIKPVNIIVACSENRVIGRGGRLPWSIPEDWQYFLDQTRGGILVMGRKTFADLKQAGGAAKACSRLVLTRDKSPLEEGASVAASLPDALAQAQTLPGETIWICGGERLYREALPLANRLHLTLVHAQAEGDTFFPDWRPYFKKVIFATPSRDSRYRYTFFIMEP